MKFVNENKCLLCGLENPVGLKLRIDYRDGKSRTVFSYQEYFQGYTGVVHGGMVGAVLDEMCVYAAASLGYVTVTGELTVRYKKPVKVETEYIAEGYVEEVRGKVIFAGARIVDGDGEVYAYARAKLVIVKRGDYEECS
ncbi:PaaI family thioesterase [candidate division WOR-3 bacterium]|nr:PaaI family thioesterase [candidate division WOR-3 bacterium]